jgi:serine/threonine protein phosphatase 1
MTILNASLQWLGLRARAPRLAPGLRIYAVGDIHGRMDLLGRLLDTIASDAQGNPSRKMLIFLGDFVDRGPDSRAVIARMTEPFPGYDTRFIRGNHDQMAMDFLDDPGAYQAWRAYGGTETLRSYGVAVPRLESQASVEELHRQFRQALPASHLAFLSGLLPFVEVGGYFFTHAGIRPGVALASQKTHDLMWTREEFLGSTADHGRVVVHGHSPSPEPVHKVNRIGVDTGAYATDRLTAAVLQGDECRFLST